MKSKVKLRIQQSTDAVFLEAETQRDNLWTYANENELLNDAEIITALDDLQKIMLSILPGEKQ
jgi:hypothetical protein